MTSSRALVVVLALVVTSHAAQTAPKDRAAADGSTNALPTSPAPPQGQVQRAYDCWVVSASLPTRTCQYILNGCDPSIQIANAELCYLCDRGFGVYNSEEDCLGAGSGAAVGSGIDPNTYPEPASPTLQCPFKGQRGNGVDCPFYRTDVVRWDSIPGWNPTPGSAITLPQSTRVLLSGCMLKRDAVYGQITIPSTSQLIIDDAPMDWKVGSIVVYGRLRIGSATCRTINPISITFRNINWVDIMSKGIMGMPGSQIDIHGNRFATWQRLAATATAGSNSLTLQAPVNWQQGQLIVIATSIWKDEVVNQNEVRTVVALGNGGQTVWLDAPLTYSHYGGPEYQVEVGLLSRTVLLRSDDEALADQRGGHVMIQGQARISGTLLYRMGQTNVRGAYPVHFHRTDNNSASFVSDSAFFASFYRCITIHQTNQLTISDNVAFHTIGSCMYIEEGVEEDNWLQGNLVVFTHVIGTPAAGALQDGMTFSESDALRDPADAAAAGFYVTNPNNAFRGNAVSGGWAGFSFPRLDKPLGFNSYRAAQGFVPHTRPLKLFDGNTAHSSGYMWQRGGCIYVGGKVWESDTNSLRFYSNGRYELETMTRDGSDVAFMVFSNSKAFLCQDGIHHWGRRVIVINWEAHDIARGATIFGSAVLTAARINRQSGNIESRFPGDKTWLLPIAGFQWYDDNVKTIIDNVTFVNYRWQGDGTNRESVWMSMVHSDMFKPSGISLTKNIRYENVEDKALMWHTTKYTGSSWLFNFFDTDGSASRNLYQQPILVGSYNQWWNFNPTQLCRFQWTWNLWICPVQPWQVAARIDVRVPWYTAAQGQVGFEPSAANTMGYMALFDYDGSEIRSVPVTRNEGTTGVTGATGWYLYLSAGATPQLQLLLTLIPPGQSIMFSTRYPAGTTFFIQRVFKYYAGLTSTLVQVSTRRQVALGDGTLYHFDGQYLTIKLVDPGDASVDPSLRWDGSTVYGARFGSLWYDIQATNLKCSYGSNGPFCPMPDSTSVPAALGDNQLVVNHPSCVDYALNSGLYANGCYWVLAKKRCNDTVVRRPKSVPNNVPASVLTYGYCAATCGVCSTPPCSNVSPDDYTCDFHRIQGDCDKSFIKDYNMCQITCGRCPWYTMTQSVVVTDAQTNLNVGAVLQQNTAQNSPAVNCSVDVQPSGGYTCAQHKSFGGCSASWMIAGGYCAKTCGRCTSAPAPASSPAPPSPKPCSDAASVPGGYTCAQQKAFGKCSASWLVDGKFCDQTCGRC